MRGWTPERREKAGGWAEIGLVGAWTLLLTWPLLFGGRVLYWGTQLLQFAPWRQLAADALRAGEWPLWTQALGNGAPLLANLQPAVFYPPHVLFLLFPVERALGYSLALHLVLAGAFAWLWARRLGLGPLGRVVTALAYAGSGFVVGHAVFPSMVEVASWLPLLFLLTDRLAARRRPGDALALGAALGVQFLAGHAQLWYYGLWAVGAYGLFAGWRVARAAGRPVGRETLRVGLLLGLAVSVAAGAAAVQMLPTAELAVQSQRADGADWEFAMTYSCWPWRFITLLAPDFFGHPADGNYWGYGHYFEDNGYVGVLPLMLAGLAVLGWVWRWVSRRVGRGQAQDLSGEGEGQGRVPFMLGMAVVALVLALGKNTPIYTLVFGYVPGFGAFQAPARFLYLYTFGVATLAGIGADRFRLSYRAQYVSRLLLAGGVALAALAAVLCWQQPALQPTFTRSTALFGGLLALSAGALLLRGRDAGADPRVARSPLPRQWWVVLVVGLIAGDLLFSGRRLNPAADPALYRLATDSGEYLRAQAGAQDPFRIFSFEGDVYDTMFGRYTRSEDFGPATLAHLRGFRETLAPNLAALEGLESANNYEPLLVGTYADLLEAVEGASLPEALRLLGMMNVRYVVSSRALPGMTPVYSDGEVLIYANPYALARARVVYHARALPNPDRLLEELTSAAFDPKTEVLLPAGDPPALAGSQSASGDPPSTVRLLRYNSNRVTIDAVLPQPGYLVLAQTLYPGWLARVDGQPARVLRANYALCAIQLPEGAHRVELAYRSLSFYLGLAASGLTWGALAVWGAWAARRRGKTELYGRGKMNR